MTSTPILHQMDGSISPIPPPSFMSIDISHQTTGSSNSSSASNLSKEAIDEILENPVETGYTYARTLAYKSTGGDQEYEHPRLCRQHRFSMQQRPSIPIRSGRVQVHHPSMSRGDSSFGMKNKTTAAMSGFFLLSLLLSLLWTASSRFYSPMAIGRMEPATAEEDFWQSPTSGMAMNDIQAGQEMRMAEELNSSAIALADNGIGIRAPAIPWHTPLTPAAKAKSDHEEAVEQLVLGQHPETADPQIVESNVPVEANSTSTVEELPLALADEETAIVNWSGSTKEETATADVHQQSPAEHSPEQEQQPQWKTIRLRLRFNKFPLFPVDWMPRGNLQLNLRVSFMTEYGDQANANDGVEVEGGNSKGGTASGA